MKTILVTGGAGFIGANLIKRLFKDTKGTTIVNIDNLNSYYDPSLKAYRLQELDKAKPDSIDYHFVKGSIADRELVNNLFAEYQFDVVVNLAAQAGVRYSIENPDAYIESNILGFYNILEACRNYPVEHLVYASSSSVYGGNKKVTFPCFIILPKTCHYLTHLSALCLFSLPSCNEKMAFVCFSAVFQYLEYCLLGSRCSVCIV